MPTPSPASTSPSPFRRRPAPSGGFHRELPRLGSMRRPGHSGRQLQRRRHPDLQQPTTTTPRSASPCRPTTTSWSRATRAHGGADPPPATNGAIARDARRRQRPHHHHRQRTLTISLSGPGSVTEGAGATYTVTLSNNLDADAIASVHIAITLRRLTESGDFNQSFLTAVQCGGGNSGVSFDGVDTLTFNSSYNHNTPFSFTLPTNRRPPGRGQRELHGRADPRPPPTPTIAPTLGNASVPTTINDNDTLTISLGGPGSVTEGAGATYTVTAVQQPRCRRHRQRPHRHHPTERPDRRRERRFHRELPRLGCQCGGGNSGRQLRRRRHPDLQQQLQPQHPVQLQPADQSTTSWSRATRATRSR